MALAGDKKIHSLYGHYVAPGKPDIDIYYDVTLIKNGHHFSVYQCSARQNDHIIFLLTASCHDQEKGFAHQLNMPALSPPDNVDDIDTRFIAPEIKQRLFHYLNDQRSFYVRPVDPYLFAHNYTRISPEIPLALWFKCKDALPKNDALHTALLAYISDMSLLNAALPQHNSSLFDQNLQIASLDHTLWIHSQADLNDWILYVQNSPWARQGRALAQGFLYNSSGQLLASSAQEGLI